MLPLLVKPETLVPPDSSSCVLHIEDRHDLLVHAPDPIDPRALVGSGLARYDRTLRRTEP